jgi:glycylpeptide N-tetradecanoyltransferase
MSYSCNKSSTGSNQNNESKSKPDFTKLTPEKYAKLMDYINRKQNGEKLGELVLDYPKNKDEAKAWTFKFWGSKPVPKVEESQPAVSIIDLDVKEKYGAQAKMFQPYSWTEFDLASDREVDDVCAFLNKNYKLDSGDNFRLYFTRDYLRWSLGLNGRVIGIRSNGVIGGVVAMSAAKFQVFERELEIADVNYLCIHQKLREKGLAQMFIDEISRYAACNENVIVGSFTTQRYVPTPMCRVEFYHRPLNYEKLYNANFIFLENGVSLDKAVSMFMVKYNLKHKVIKMSEDYYDDVYNMLCKYQDKYNYYQKYSRREFEHFFKNSSIVSSYIILGNGGEVLDFFSYYKLPYYVVASANNSKTPKFINAVYMHMYTSLNVTQLTIFKSAILSAYEEGNDVLNCTDIMENVDILFDNFSRFCKGTGYLYYNFYNLQCPEISPQQICKVTL